MPARSQEEKERRRKLFEQRKEARQKKKEEEERKAGASNQADKEGDTVNQAAIPSPANLKAVGNDSALILLPDDSMRHVLCFLASRELGNVSMSCHSVNHKLQELRIPYLFSRLNRPHQHLKASVGYIDMCRDEAEARTLIKLSFGGDTKRLVTKKSKRSKGGDADEFIAYARFVEEAVSGYSPLGFRSKNPEMMSPFVSGRFASVSPEHTVVRVGGDGHKCGGGSGVMSWGVGTRGQLGHGKREDESFPRVLVGGLGYGIRIVQVAAGGGLVRVAHTLLLTSTGRVLSFGCGQYGALGHGYSAGKQLPDILRPQYIEALGHLKCTCVAAGELHSAAVTTDGDLYTWGDGFCGQLGHGDKRPQLEPKQVECGGMEDECVASVSCGARHTLSVTEDGEVFSFGLGHFGVLGRSFTPFDYDADAAVIALGGDVAEPVAGRVVPPAGEQVPDPVLPEQVPAFAAAMLNAADEAGTGMDEDTRANLDLLANMTLDDSSNQCIPTVIDCLDGVKIVGVSAGHRHSLILDDQGCLYSFGAGNNGALGHGDTLSQMYPLKVMEFVDENIKIMQMSAGVDMSMAVSTTGDVYGWGKTDEGRIGLGMHNGSVMIPRRVQVPSSTGEPVKAVDVDCGYVHSIIVALNGTIHVCGGVGTDGQDDGQREEVTEADAGRPFEINGFNIWHRLAEPKIERKVEKWSKYGKYELKGRSKMLADAEKWS